MRRDLGMQHWSAVAAPFHPAAVALGDSQASFRLTGREFAGKRVVHSVSVVQDVIGLQLLVPRRLAHHLRGVKQVPQRVSNRHRNARGCCWQSQQLAPRPGAQVRMQRMFAVSVC